MCSSDLDEGTDNSTYATYPFNGYFSIDSTATFDSTLQSISSKTSSACNGDSGAPVVWENGNESILLGVNVGGGGKENNCRQISGDSSYKTEVQIPTRHSTILVNSIVKASPTEGTALKNAIEDKLKAEQEVSTLKSTMTFWRDLATLIYKSLNSFFSFSASVRGLGGSTGTTGATSFSYASFLTSYLFSSAICC